MSMDHVNWDLAPEGAVAIKQDKGKCKHVTWIKEDGSWWCGNDAAWYTDHANDWVQTIATRPQPEPRKTVADAVEAYPDGWPLHGEFDTLWYTAEYDLYGCFQTQASDLVKVCTREEFEAYVKEQEGEKWTHKYKLGDSSSWWPCSIVTEVGSQGVVIECDVFEGVQYCSYHGEQAIELKPIKPTIAKAQSEFLCEFSADTNNMTVIAEVESYLNKHEVIDDEA